MLHTRIFPWLCSQGTRERHSTLLQIFVNYVRKTFIVLAPGFVKIVCQTMKEAADLKFHVSMQQMTNSVVPIDIYEI